MQVSSQDAQAYFSYMTKIAPEAILQAIKLKLHMKLLGSFPLHSTPAGAKYLGQHALSRRIIAVFLEYYLYVTFYSII